MIDKYVSIIGVAITIFTILGTSLYTQGVISNKLETFEKDTNTHSIKINKNQEAIQDLEVSVGKIETMIDERYNRLESLIMEM